MDSKIIALIFVASVVVLDAVYAGKYLDDTSKDIENSILHWYLWFIYMFSYFEL